MVLIEEIMACYFLFLLTNTKEKDKQKLIYIDLLDHLWRSSGMS